MREFVPVGTPAVEKRPVEGSDIRSIGKTGNQSLVPPARLERALPKKRDFESRASTNSATGALHIAGCQCIRGDLCSAKEF